MQYYLYTVMSKKVVGEREKIVDWPDFYFFSCMVKRCVFSSLLAIIGKTNYSKSECVRWCYKILEQLFTLSVDVSIFTLRNIVSRYRLKSVDGWRDFPC